MPSDPTVVLGNDAIMTMPNLANALLIPDSLLAKEATDILREHSTDLLFNHSISRLPVSRLSRGVRGNSTSTLNCSMWLPHFTISA